MFLHVTCAWLHFTFTLWSKGTVWSDVIQQYMQASSLLISKVTSGTVWCGISAGQSWQADIINMLRVGNDLLVCVGGMMLMITHIHTPDALKIKACTQCNMEITYAHVHTDTHAYILLHTQGPSSKCKRTDWYVSNVHILHARPASDCPRKGQGFHVWLCVWHCHWAAPSLWYLCRGACQWVSVCTARY